MERSSTALESWRTSSTLTSACSRVLWRSFTSSLIARSSTLGIRSIFRTASVRDRPTASILFHQSSIALLNPVQNSSNNQRKTDGRVTVNVDELSAFPYFPPAYRLRQGRSAQPPGFGMVRGNLDSPVYSFTENAREQGVMFRNASAEN